MIYLWSKSLLIAGVCGIPLLAAAPTSAHVTGKWIDGEATTCGVICEKKGLLPARSGHYRDTTSSYNVCRLRSSDINYNRRPGFNLQAGTSANRCVASGTSSLNTYDCLCLLPSEPSQVH